MLLTREQAHEVEAILAAVPDPVIVCDAAGNITRANPAARIAFAEPLVDVPSRVLLERLGARRPDGTALSHEWCSTPDTLIAEHILIADASGQTCHISLSVSPLMDAEGPYGAVAVWHDITEQQRVLEQQRLLVRDLEESRERLAHSERLYRGIGELIPYGIWIADPELTGSYVSDSFSRLIGRDASALTSEERLALYAPEDRERVRAAWTRAVEEGTDINLQARVRGADGADHWVWHRGVALGRPGERPVAWVGINLDIQDMKAAEEERQRLLERLERKRQLLQTILSQIPAEVIALDARGEVVLQSERFRMHHPFADPSRPEAWASQAPEAAGPHARRLMEALQRRTEINGEHLQVGAGEEQRHLLLYVSPLHTGAGEIDGVVATTVDITELERAAHEQERLLAEVQRERALLEAIISEMPGSTVILLPPDGRLMYVHEKILNLRLRPDPDHPIIHGRPPFEIQTMEGQPVLPEQWAVMRSLKYGESFSDRRERLRFAGFERVISIYSQPVRDDQGRIIAAIMTFFDVTERVAADEELRQHRDHLAELVRQRTLDLEQNNAELRRHREQLRGLAVELAQAEERARQDLAIALHDTVAQTLAFAVLAAQTAAATSGEPDVRERLAELVRQMHQAIAEVRAVISELTPTLRSSDLREGLRLLGRQVGSRHHYAVDVLADDLPAMDDKILTVLYRSVRELLTNAAKHARARQVTIRCAVVEDMLELQVEDDGVGFDRAQLERGDGTHFGLLSIAEHLAHLGGDMQVYSQPGAGARFVLRVPVHAALAAGSTEP